MSGENGEVGVASVAETIAAGAQDAAAQLAAVHLDLRYVNTSWNIKSYQIHSNFKILL